LLIESIEAGLLARWNDKDLHSRGVDARLLQESIEVISRPWMREVNDDRAEPSSLAERRCPTGIGNEDSGFVVLGGGVLRQDLNRPEFGER
jgi:hypothetical protein